MGAGRSLSHWIIESAVDLQPIKMLIISTELFSKWVVFCIVHCIMQSAMMAYINVQCILDCLPVSVSTEPVYSDDQFANSYSNPYKLIYQCPVHKNFGIYAKDRFSVLVFGDWGVY